MPIDRSFANILSDRLPETRDFYVALLGFAVAYDSDWFVSLRVPGREHHELGVWRRDHELVPERYRGASAGVVLTFVVDDVDAVHRRALAMGAKVVEPPRDTFYGQRSMILEDPNGQPLDVSSPVTRAEGTGAGG